MGRLKILQMPTNFRPGGIQRHVLDLTEALRAEGHHVYLAGDDGDWRSLVDGPDYLPLPLTALTWEGGGMAARLARLPGTVLALRRWLASHPADVIHTHETAPAMVARLATLGRKVPVVMTYHGAAPEREAEAARQARLFADIVNSPSRMSLDRLIDKGLPEEKTVVIGNGVAPLADVAPDAVAAKRAVLLGGHDGPLVFSLSRMSVQKGLDDMIAVARQVLDDQPGAVFAVGGGGPLAEEVADQVARSGLGDQFRLLGPVTEVAEHLLASDLYLLTSRWENLPISIVEAFRAGLPVVATDCGGVRELVDDQVGALCKVGDVDDLAKAVSGLLADAPLRAAKGAAARKRAAEDRFDPDAVHARFAALFADLVAHRS